ncbi:hypothetical protein A2U01_0057897, partial [Trifolium medium]|nr:hypothetical protein [Trifolium medium]
FMQGYRTRCAVQFTSSSSLFWKVRVAQAGMARRATGNSK